MNTIHAISDLHGHEPELPGGELLIIAGDCTATDSMENWEQFAEYLDTLDYGWIVLVAGNHDGMLQDYRASVRLPPHVRYVEDELIEIAGLKIYGSPWTPRFGHWAFMGPESDLMEKWEAIPEDIDILVTHGPPYGILDGTKTDGHCGCRGLQRALPRVQPKVHIFGHIHEAYGRDAEQWLPSENITKYYNVSHSDERYRPANSVTVVNIE